MKSPFSLFVQGREKLPLSELFSLNWSRGSYRRLEKSSRRFGEGKLRYRTYQTGVRSVHQAVTAGRVDGIPV